MEVTKDFEGECQCNLSRHIFIEYCLVHVRTDIKVLINRYEYLKGLVESSCSENDLKRCMECNCLLKSIIENSKQDNQKLVEKMAALQEAITHTRKCNGRLLEEANKQMKRNDSEESARILAKCQKIMKKLALQVVALEQEKAQLEAAASSSTQKGSEPSGLSRDSGQNAQVSLETKCRSLEQELKKVSEEKASLAERLVSQGNVEAELTAARHRCECSERQLAAAENSRLTRDERSLAKQVQLEAKLKTAEAQVQQLQEELQEARRRLSEQITAVEERNKLLDKAKQENITTRQKNACQVEIFQKIIDKLECRVESTQATEEQLTARRKDIEQLVYALETRNEVIRHLEEQIASVNAKWDQRLNGYSRLENGMKELINGFENEFESKEEHVEHLQQEVEKLEKVREQLISINDDAAGQIKEWQTMVVSLCLMIDEVKDSLTEQTPEKKNARAKTAVTSNASRLRVLFSSSESQNSVSMFCKIKGSASEMPAEVRQVEHSTERSQILSTSALTKTEQSSQVGVCTGDSVVASVKNMIEDIKAQLRATLKEEIKKRNQEQIPVSKPQEAGSELKVECRELETIKLELKAVEKKYNCVKREMHELKQQNQRLLKDMSVAEDTMKRIDHETNESSSEITAVQDDVKKGLYTIRKQCNTIKELENTIKDLRKMLHECSATTKDEPQPSPRIQEKADTPVTKQIPPPEVTNKEQSSAEIAQDTAAADHLPSGTNLLEDGEYLYEKMTSELEVRIKRMECSHHEEVENLNRVQMENLIALQMSLERETAKDRKTYEELVGKQQEMHKEQINELNQLHDSERSLLWGDKERERISKETQSPEECTETLPTGAEVFSTQNNGSTDPVTDKETIRLIEENSFEMSFTVLKQQCANELDSLKTEHARKLADITAKLKNGLAEEEASLEEQLRALREGNEQELLRLKTRYCSEMKHEKEKFNLCMGAVLESANKALPVTAKEAMDIKPSSGDGTTAEARCDTSRATATGTIVLDDIRAQLLRCLVHSGTEVLTAEQLAALHNLVCPSSCSGPTTFLPHESGSQSLLLSQSDISDGKSGLLDEMFFGGCDTESEMDYRGKNVLVDFELKCKMPDEVQKIISS